MKAHILPLVSIISSRNTPCTMVAPYLRS